MKLSGIMIMCDAKIMTIHPKTERFNRDVSPPLQKEAANTVYPIMNQNEDLSYDKNCAHQEDISVMNLSCKLNKSCSLTMCLLTQDFLLLL